MALKGLQLGIQAFKTAADKVLMSGVGRTFTGLQKGMTPSPSDKFLIGLPAAGFAGSLLGPPTVEAAESLFVDPLRAVTKEQRFNRATELYRLRKERALRKEFFDMQMKMQESIRQLAFYSPQKYQELLAGRKLPQDAVVIGGSPRTDLLQQFATDFAMRSEGSPNLQMEPDPLQEIGL